MEKKAQVEISNRTVSKTPRFRKKWTYIYRYASQVQLNENYYVRTCSTSQFSRLLLLWRAKWDEPTKSNQLLSVKLILQKYFFV